MFLNLKVFFFCCILVTICKAQPNEAIHLHFDKDIYLPGETIWFKVYVHNATAPGAISTNFYTAIYDEQGKLLEKKSYPIIEGTCNGDFTLPDTIPAGKIQFIAFTKAMLMTDSNNVYEKIITVYQKKNQSQNITATIKNINLQFFPEGGNWVAGLNNFIAYKAWYDDGSPAQVSGNIMEEESHTAVDSFSTNKLGLGKLQITPEQKKYTALFTDEHGKSIKIGLPPVNATGIAFHAELVKNELYYIINKNGENENLKTLHLLAQMNNAELYKADILIGDKNRIVYKFPVDSMPSGIVQLTVFDDNWVPLQERIVFINTDRNKKILANEVEKDLSPKAKNIIEIQVPDTLLTNLSASIADINFYNKETRASIQQDIWFKSQLKGLNKNISEEIETGNSSAIDLIMLTHGWRKYDWKKVINKQVSKPATVDNYLSLTVNYKEKKYALPKNENLNLIINDTAAGKQFYFLNPISQTAFEQSGIIFYDSAKVYYQLNKNKDLAAYLSVTKNTGIQIPASIDPMKTAYTQSLIPVYKIQSLMDTLAGNRERKFNEMKIIKEVIIKSRYVNPITKRTLELDKKYTSGMFSGITRGFQMNVLDDEKAWTYTDIFSYIRSKVPARLYGVGPVGSRQLYPCSMNAYDVCAPIMLFVDETEMSGETLETISVSQVAYIKYINGIVIGSSFRTNAGVLFVYKRKGDEAIAGPNNMRTINIKGYDIPKEFFNPDYSDKESLTRADLRTTLYWNPYILTDKNNNKVKLEYYNNDISKKLLLTIEGINEEGELIHFEKIIE